MLTYLVQVTESLFIVAVLSGFVFAFARHAWGRVGRIVSAGCIAGWLVAAVVAYLRNTTRLIDSGLWNVIFSVAYLVGLVVFLVLLARPLASRLGRVGEILQKAGLAIMIFGVTGYMARQTFEYPFDIIRAVTNVMSTDFFFKFIGWIVGLVLMWLVAYGTYKTLLALKARISKLMCAIGGTAGAVLLCGLGLRAMLTRRMVPQNPLFMQYAVFASNGNTTFVFIMAALVVVCIALLAYDALHANEPYNNPAQHRMIRAKWRSRRRWAVACAVCVAFSLVNVTAIKAWESREVELSPSEDCELRDDGCYVSFDQVDDGHLHRFTYTTDKGTGIRFIVIKKPGGNSYGIGLDACDICGETGYYERDGNQVVCKKCDVVMNVQTIGFKGGCNPIVIDYDIRDGYIHIPYDTLLEHEDIFKK